MRVLLAEDEMSLLCAVSKIMGKNNCSVYAVYIGDKLVEIKALSTNEQNFDNNGIKRA